MVKKMNTRVTPKAVAVASEPPAAEGPMQNLKTLNGLLLKEIAQLRSKLVAVSADRCIEDGIERGVCGVVLSTHLDSAAEGCAALLRKADDDLDAEMAAAAETTASLVKKADACSAELSLAKSTLLAVSGEKDVIERDLERVVAERDLIRSDLEEKRMQLEYLEEKIWSMEPNLIAAAAECRELEEKNDSLKRLLEEKNVLTVKLTRENEEMKEEGKSREESLQYAKLEIDSLKRLLEEKKDLIVILQRENEKVKEEGKIREESLQFATREIDSLKGSLEEKKDLMVKLTGENEKMKEEGKIREEALQSATLEIDSMKGSLEENKDLIVKLQRENEKVKEEGKMNEQILVSAMHDKGLLEEKIQLTTRLVRENEEAKNRKEVEMKLLNAEIEASASKICSLEEKCCYLNEIRNRLTDEVAHLKKSLDELNENLMDAQKKSKWRNFKWLYPAAATIFVVSLSYAARAL